jgi:hypothetical protein
MKVELEAGIDDEAWLNRGQQDGEDSPSDGLVLFE